MQRVTSRRGEPAWAALPLAIGLLVVLAVAAPRASAQSIITWIGGGANANWLTAENWNGTAPVNSGTRALVFDGSLLTTNTNNVSNLAASSITFNTAGFVLSGSAIRLAGTITNSAVSGTQTINLGMDLGTASRTLTGTTGSVIILAGPLTGSGAGGLTINRTVTLTGSNSYTGSTLVNSNARVNIGHASALGSGTLQFEIGDMSFDNSSGGPLTIGNALFNRAATGGAVFIGTNDLTTTGTYRTNATGQELIVQNNVLTVGGLETGGATVVLTKEGTGTLRVNGPAGPTLSRGTAGGIRVNIGGIAVAHPLALGTAGPLRFAGIAGAGPTELIVETDLTGTNALSVPIILDGVSALTTISGSYGVTFTGPWTINRTQNPFNRNLRNSLTSGTLRIEGSVSAGATAQPYPIVFEGSGPTVISGPILQPIGNTMSLTKNDSGSLTLSGSATYSGTTSVNGGILLLSTTAAVTGTAPRSYAVGVDGTLGSGFALDQAFLNRLFTNSAGVIALGADSSNALDFSATGANLGAMSLGAVGSGTQTYSGALTQTGTYRLGGGGGTLAVSSLLSGSNALIVGGGTAGVGGTVILPNTANSFTGKTTVPIGTLSFASIGNVGGGNSSLGAPTNSTNGTIDLGSGTNVVTLRYVGTGHSTDRVINLAGSAGGGGVLDSSGSGPVSFTGGVTGAAGTTLTLMGSNTGVNFITAVTGSNVTKSGVGTWVFGTNSFTGRLSIEQGTIVAASNAPGGSGTSSSLGRENGPIPVIGLANATGTAALLAANGVTISRVIEVAALGSGDQEVVFGGSGAGTATFDANSAFRLGRGVTLAADPGGNVRFLTPTANWDQQDGSANPAVAVTIGTPTATGTVTLETTLPDSITQVTVRQGTLRLGNGTTVGALGPTSVLTGSAGATLAFDRSDTIRSGADFAATIGGAMNVTQLGSGTVNLAGANTYTGTTSIAAGAIRVSGSGRIADSARIDVGAAGRIVFDRPDDYGGAYDGKLTGSGLLSVLSGSLTLTGLNTFTGSSEVLSGAVLQLNGQINNAALDIASGATLMGSGTSLGTTTIAGIHRPGNSPGIQTFQNLSYLSGATVYWDLWGNTTTNGSPLDYDQVIVSGNLAFSGATAFNLVFTGSSSPTDFSDVAWANSFWDTDREWLVYDVAGTTTGFITNLSLTPANWQDSTGASFNTARSLASFRLEQRTNDVFLVYSAIPEPGSLALAGIGLAAAAWAGVNGGRRRRRR
jgi:autotransporter-associated beta strand protein